MYHSRSCCCHSTLHLWVLFMLRYSNLAGSYKWPHQRLSLFSSSRYWDYFDFCNQKWCYSQAVSMVHIRECFSKSRCIFRSGIARSHGYTSSMYRKMLNYFTEWLSIAAEPLFTSTEYWIMETSNTLSHRGDPLSLWPHPHLTGRFKFFANMMGMKLNVILNIHFINFVEV